VGTDISVDKNPETQSASLKAKAITWLGNWPRHRGRALTLITGVTVVVAFTAIALKSQPSAATDDIGVTLAVTWMGGVWLFAIITSWAHQKLSSV
jgi:hypothetical protein